MFFSLFPCKMEHLRKKKTEKTVISRTFLKYYLKHKKFIGNRPTLDREREKKQVDELSYKKNARYIAYVRGVDSHLKYFKIKIKLVRYQILHKSISIKNQIDFILRILISRSRLDSLIIKNK